MKREIMLHGLVVLLIAGGFFALMRLQEKNVSVVESAVQDLSIKRELITALVTLPEGFSREELVDRIGQALHYDEAKTRQLHDTYRAMQWDTFNEFLVPHLVEIHELTDTDREVLLTHSSVYLDVEEDILEGFYEPGAYTFSSDTPVAKIAELLTSPLLDTMSTGTIGQYLRATATDAVLAYVRREAELLPDLIPIPAQDIGVREEGGRTLLVFTTVYYNAGRGPLELRADQSTIGTVGDFVRGVAQRVYRFDGTYRERAAGSFEWHNEHLHYHFADFVEYRLSEVDGRELAEGGLSEKSTFCIRDVSRVFYESAPKDEAAYRICGRERQGISAGWGDAYFHTYPDQNFDITGYPSGTYTLSFFANPEDRFDEITKKNNSASATFRYNDDDKTIEVLETLPHQFPQFEHIYTEDIYTGS